MRIKTVLMMLLSGWAGVGMAITPEALEAVMKQHYGEPKSVTGRRGGDDLFCMEFQYARMLGKSRTLSLICFKPSEKLKLQLIRGGEPAPLAVQAQRSGAVAGINAGSFYHDPERGWMERGQLRINGRDLPSGATWKAHGGGYLTLDEAGNPALIAEADLASSQAHSAVWVFPRLLTGGKPAAFQSNYCLLALQHPRSVIGIFPDGWVMLMVVNGRQPYYATGMTVSIVLTLLQTMGCTDAALLDGGSCSTLYWAAGDGPGEILNYPPDNRLFDHEGARDVSSVLVLTRP